MVTIKQLSKAMKKKGYKLTPATIKYYVDMGLMPPASKKGGYGEGVKLVFHDEEEAIKRLMRIFALKGKGFKLSEIREKIKEDEIKYVRHYAIKNLERYKFIDGHYLEKLDDNLNIVSLYRTQNYIKKDSSQVEYNLENFMAKLPEFKERHPAFILSTKLYEVGFEMVKENELFYPLAVVKNILVVYPSDFRQIINWIMLRHEYNLEWETLKDLYEQHKLNIDNNYIFWPEPDGVRFSEAMLGVQKQQMLNELGDRLISFFGDNKGDFIGNPFIWGCDSKYESIQKFVDDFLNGRCALVRGYDGGYDFFIRF